MGKGGWVLGRQINRFAVWGWGQCARALLAQDPASVIDDPAGFPGRPGVLGHWASASIMAGSRNQTNSNVMNGRNKLTGFRFLSMLAMVA